MKTYQNLYVNGQWKDPLHAQDAQLVLLFGDRTLATNSAIHIQIREAFPYAEIIGCTTSGEILDDELFDNSLCLTAITFKHSHIQVEHASVDSLTLLETTTLLAHRIEHEGLKYLLVLSDGQVVNGTELVEGLANALPKGTLITGGLSGDGTRFSETVVWHNDQAKSGQVVVCGFYGDSLGIGHGSMGGWDPFGPERVITHSEANTLYSLDRKPALALYKAYLGEHAANLPASALLFPLLIKRKGEDESVIRTILNINEDDGSMIFAGDIPEGSTAQLMRANFERLIDGAEGAAESALQHYTQHSGDGLVLMISCVGRRLVLNQRVEEELEVVKDVFGDHWAYTGFYSYGELSPRTNSGACALHNQTMTITTIFEHDA